MGTSQAWRARIESIGDGRVLGTGFLIDSTRVLTCAHVVDRHTKVHVTFLGAGTSVSAEAEVDFRGPWSDSSRLGDVAVVTLSHPVSIQPAQLASPTALRDRRLDPVSGELHTYGFPRGFDDEGADSRVCAPYEAPHRGEWVQLEPISQRGISLQKGFSGAAVTLADSGAVVGMVVGAESKHATGTGKMLPLAAIEYHWQPLGDYLPLGDLSAAAAQELRAILENVRVAASASEIYSSCLPSGIGPTPPRLETLWDAARFVAEELVAPSGHSFSSPLARFCLVVLRRIATRHERSQLRGWIRRHLTLDDDDLRIGYADLPNSGSVVVRVVPSAERQHYLLTVSSYDGDSGHVLYSGRQRIETIRPTVERILPSALERIPDRVAPEDVMVQFELPLSWLGKPVDEWYAGGRDGAPIGWTYPVVVRDLGTAVVAYDRPRLVRRRWQLLCGQTKSRLYAVDCRDTRDRRSLTAWLSTGDVRTILALSTAPRNPESHKAVRAGLAVGIPVMLWTRTRCTDDHNHVASCGGDQFIDLLREALESTAPRQLPQRVRALRVSAHGEQSELTRCKAVTLFWHDPDIAPREQSPLVLAE